MITVKEIANIKGDKRIYTIEAVDFGKEKSAGLLVDSQKDANQTPIADFMSKLQNFANKANDTIDKSFSLRDGSRFSIRTKPEPKNTDVAYKVFLLKDGKLYPPMVNPTGEATPVGQWLDAEEGKSATPTKIYIYENRHYIKP